jgi:lambda family phage portal protein
MKIIDNLARRFGFVRRDSQQPQRRSFQAAQTSRLTSDWLSPGTSADAELRGALPTLIARTREAERNDDYVRRYLSLLENNVLGAQGIGLQVKARENDQSLDRLANTAIEWAWWKWGRKDNCTVTRQHTWRAVQRLVLRSAKRDGGVLVRKIPGFSNKFRFALQLIEIDCLDIDLNATLPGGWHVRMGVEYDEWHSPVAYHVFSSHPGDSGLIPRAAKRRERIPVAQLLHVFCPDRIGQTLGIPAPSATLQRLKMLAGYEEAELVAAREAACKGYGIKQATTEGYSGQNDADGNVLQDIEPGMGLRLNPGEEYFGIDPQHPMDAYPTFIKSILRAVAGGLGVSYNSLANDLEGVNYSSLRAGLLDEREEWKAVQQWLIEDLCEPVFEEWLGLALAGGLIRLPNGSALPVDKFDKFNAPEFKPRRWPWVDPLKDMNSNVLAVEKGFDSRRRIISEQGNDIEDIFQEQAEDEKLAAEFNLEFPKDKETAPTAEAPGGGGAAGRTARALTTPDE